LNPIEEALAFKRYVEEYGYGSVTELARRIGKSHSYVSRRIALLSLPEDVREEPVWYGGKGGWNTCQRTTFCTLDNAHWFNKMQGHGGG